MSSLLEKPSSTKHSFEYDYFNNQLKRNSIERLSSVWTIRNSSIQRNAHSLGFIDHLDNDNSPYETIFHTSWYGTEKRFEASQLHSDLFEIKKEIKCSKYILELKPGWDGYNAKPIPEKIYYTSLKILIEYSNFILDNLELIICPPEINPGINENIFLSWRSEVARLAISIESNMKGEEVLIYYGDSYKNNESIKGTTSAKNVSMHLAYWMKNLA